MGGRNDERLFTERIERDGELYTSNLGCPGGVDGSGFGFASRFVALVLLRLLAHNVTYYLRKVWRPPLEILHSIVLSVMVVISPYNIGASHDGTLTVCLSTVTVIVVLSSSQKGLDGGFLIIMTVMTVFCGPLPLNLIGSPITPIGPITALSRQSQRR